MDKIRFKMYEALKKKYEGEMLDAEASLLVYFTNPVGIGEHPQHIEEMDKLIESVTGYTGLREGRDYWLGVTWQFLEV